MVAGSFPPAGAGFFAADFGADFYGLPRNEDTITLQRRPWTPPASYDFGTDRIVPMFAGESLNWSLVS